MTLVCAKLDNSYGTPRLTALADTRACVRRLDGSLETISDTTTKLFVIPVRCYVLDNLSPVLGSWENPYFETVIGLGFSGFCFEGLTVIAHVTQALSALVSHNGDTQNPDKEGLVHFIHGLTENYFDNHKNLQNNPSLSMLVFGFDDQRPWIGKVTWDTNTRGDFSVDWADEDSLVSIGQDSQFLRDVTASRTRISEKKARYLEGRNDSEDGNNRFRGDVSLARKDIADKEVTENEMLRHIESNALASIGGVLQRLELAVVGQKVVSVFTKDDRSYLNIENYSVSSCIKLAPAPIIERMGS